jgi:hypothetical protein
MKRTLGFVALALAIGSPLAALADEEASASTAQAVPAMTGNAASSAANSSDKTNLIVVKNEKRTSLTNFVVPKYLTIQQENDAYQRAYDAQFGLNHTP